RGDQLKLVARGKLVLHVDGEPPVIHLGNRADHLLGAKEGGTLFVGLVFLRYVAAQEAFGVAPVRQRFQFIHHVHVERLSCQGVVDGTAIDLGGAGDVVGAFGAAFDLQRVHTHLDQLRHVLNGPKVLGVHDVGAVLIFVGGNVATGAVGFFQQDFFGLEGFYAACRGGDEVACLVVA